MTRSATTIALVFLVTSSIQAQVKKFPYEAVITQDETYVRSGPGTRYYPTSRLAKGERVAVHRHDPGGWYMIAPPKGSFSWIRAEYVQVLGDNRGTLTENQIVVRVGSEFGDNREVEQKRLSRGDTVQILGEKTFNTELGAVRMLKIAPPRGEYRWVPGQFLAPVDSIARNQHETNPFNTPTEIKEKPKPAPKREEPKVDPFRNNPPTVTDNGFNERPMVRVKPGDAVVRTDKPQASKDEAKTLADLDSEFRRIIRQETHEWNFVSLEEGYRSLLESASTDAFKDQLDQRFAALAKYQKIKDQYDDFVRLTKETAERDAQLLNMTGKPNIVSKPPQSQQRQPSRPPVRRPEMRPVPEQQLPPNQQTPPAQLPRKTRSQPVSPPSLDGAGIIQKAAATFPGAPGHVLLSPNGKILAYLEAKGSVDLNQHLGQSMGIVGPRSYRTDLQADFIEVQSVVPVRLK